MSDLKQHADDIRDSLKAIDELVADADAAVENAYALIERLSNEVAEQWDLVRMGSVVALDTPKAALEWIADRINAELDAWEE